METQTQEYKSNKAERRKELRELSKIAKQFQNGACPDMSINEILINHFYKDDNNQEFKTLYDWSKAGFKVVKGSKSFVIWGKPKAIKDKNQETPKQKTEEEEESEFYPLCYLFSNAQVEKK